MLLGFNDSKCTAYTVDSAKGLIVIRTHLILDSSKLILQKMDPGAINCVILRFHVGIKNY